jgi:hypothetical protein
VTQVPEEVWHGTLGGYTNHGCRCPACSGAMVTYNRSRFLRPCVEGCGRLTWHHKGRDGRCPRCTGAKAAESVRPDTLRCSTCREWKPDEEFPPSRGRLFARRERRTECHACEAARKRAWRAANREQYNRRERDRKRAQAAKRRAAAVELEREVLALRARVAELEGATA